MYKALIFCGLFLGGLLPPLISEEILTMSEAVRIALDNNYSIKIVKKGAEIATNNLSAGNAGMLPRIDATASGNYSVTDFQQELAFSRTSPGENGEDEINDDQGVKTNKAVNYNAAIQLNWTLFDGFAMFSSYEKYVELRNKSGVEIQIIMEAAIKNLINAYFESLKLQSHLDILKNNLSISNERLSRIRDAYNYGVISKLEVYKAESDRNLDSSAFLQTDLAFNNMLRNLNFIMGIDISSEYRLESAVNLIDSFDSEGLKNKTFENNSFINKALRERSISELDRELINSAYYPRITFQSGYSFARSENDASFLLLNENIGYNVGLNASWNLFDGFRNNIQSQNAEINILISDLTYEDIKRQIELNFINTFDTYERRREALELEEANLKTAEENFRRSKELYELGQISSLEFRDSQINLMNAGKRINDTRYAAKVAESELLLISGQFF